MRERKFESELFCDAERLTTLYDIADDEKSRQDWEVIFGVLILAYGAFE